MLRRIFVLFLLLGAGAIRLSAVQAADVQRQLWVTNAFGDDVHLAGIQCDGFIPEFDIEGALEDEEEVIGIFVAVPDEFTFGLYHHDIAVIVLGDSARGKIIGEG